MGCGCVSGTQVPWIFRPLIAQGLAKKEANILADHREFKMVRQKLLKFIDDFEAVFEKL